MFCSNCGAPLPENGICTKCGVKATNMTFTGNVQGQPVAPQQQFYNPNPMYVQYQGSNFGYGQPFVPQENVAIKGIKDPKMVSGIAATIKDSCGSMVMVLAALFLTVAMIFSFIEVIYSASSATYRTEDVVALSNVIAIFARCIPFTIFTIGAWMVVFQGYGTYDRRMYNDYSCMSTSGFSTIQAGGIVMLVPTIAFSLFMLFIMFMTMIAGAVSVFGDETGLGEDVGFAFLCLFIAVLMLIFVIILASSLISQMSKIKHAIRGRNYESISVLLPVFLFIMAAVQIISLVYSAWEADIVWTLISGVYALCYSVVACAFLYVRSRANSFIMQAGSQSFPVQ